MSWYREKCLEEKPERCEICGSEEEIEIHHKDGDPTNNSLENLVPLCREHHMEVHESESPDEELNDAANTSDDVGNGRNIRAGLKGSIPALMAKDSIRNLKTRKGFQIRLPAEKCKDKGMEKGEPVVILENEDEVGVELPEPDFKIYRVFEGEQ